MHDQKTKEAYHKWDKEFCTDASPTYWECWQAACDVMQKQIIRLEADFNDALIERNNAEKREYEILGRANALEAKLKEALRDLELQDELIKKQGRDICSLNERLDACDELLREEFAQRQDAITYLTPEQRQEYQSHLSAGMRKMRDAMTPNYMKEV